MAFTVRDLPDFQELLAEGREEVRAEWAAALHRQATRRFGADERLDALLDCDLASLAGVSDIVLEPTTTVDALLHATA